MFSQVEEEEINLDRLCRGFNGRRKSLSWKEKKTLLIIHTNKTNAQAQPYQESRLIGRKPLKSLC